MSQKIWEINGLSLELNLEDADCMERYENAFDKMSEEKKQLPKDGKSSVQIRAYCRLFRNLYDRLFGEGTSEKIFKGIPDNTDVYDEVYYSFLDFAAAQKVAAKGTYNIHFCLIAPDGRSYRKLSGSLYIHTAAQGVNQ